jgi:hypothetical protein
VDYKCASLDSRVDNSPKLEANPLLHKGTDLRRTLRSFMAQQGKAIPYFYLRASSLSVLNELPAGNGGAENPGISVASIWTELYVTCRGGVQ